MIHWLSQRCAVFPLRGKAQLRQRAALGSGLGDSRLRLGPADATVLSRAWGNLAMNKQRVKKISVKKVEDTEALQWARVANRGEEKRSGHRIKVIQRAAAIRCSDLEREKKALEIFLVKVTNSTGYLHPVKQQR